MAVRNNPLQIFCSFAPEDEALCQQFHNHLRLLEREGRLTLWHQRLITAGTDWAKTIDEHLASASVILLLISPAFFASDYCFGVEMKQAMQQHETGETRVIPILLRPVDWTLAPFAHLPLFPTNRKAVTEWSNRDAAFVDIVVGLRNIIEELPSGSVGNMSRKTASGVWNVPYRRNPHFTGRDELLSRLDEQLSPKTSEVSTTAHRAALTQPQALKGLGGIGKTQVAVEYAYRSLEQGRYAHTLWVNAASEEAIMASFVMLAQLLPAFPAKKETDQHKLAEAIKHWLEQSQQRWLLIFDNADDVSMLQEYLPSTGNGGILFTTRANAVGSLAASVEVETMGFVEGSQFLLHRAQRLENASDEEVNEAGNIVVALDHFPLALDQAGAYIEETKCRLADYLKIYQARRKTLLARRGQQTTNYPDSVETTWSLSFQRVEQNNPAAGELLRLCAFLAPDGIPEELIRDGAPYWPSILQEGVTDLFVFNRMFEELLQFSLVQRLSEKNMFSIHRLVQAVQRDKMGWEEQSEWGKRVVRAVNTVFPHGNLKKEIASWSLCLRYLEQAQTCDSLIRQYQFLLPDAAELLDRTGTYLREHASYSIAEPLYQQALSIWKHLSGSEHLQITFPMHNLAMLYREQGRYEEAEPLYWQVLRIREQILGPDHPDMAAVLHNLATLYKRLGKYEEAEPLYLRALDLNKRVLGPDHPDVAAACHSLATLYKRLGRHEEAEVLHHQALSSWEHTLGPNHPNVAAALHNLANLYFEQKKYIEAEPFYQRALSIWEHTLGPEHPHLASSLIGCAGCCQEQNRYTEAELLYQRALHIWEHQSRSDHPDMAYPLHYLGSLYVQQGKYAEAEPLYQRALSIREQILGPEHPDTADTLHSIAGLREAQGDSKNAILFYRRALAIREQIFVSEHPDILETRKRLQDVLLATGQAAENIPVIATTAKTDPPETDDTLHGIES